MRGSCCSVPFPFPLELSLSDPDLDDDEFLLFPYDDEEEEDDYEEEDDDDEYEEDDDDEYEEAAADKGIFVEVAFHHEELPVIFGMNLSKSSLILMILRLRASLSHSTLYVCEYCQSAKTCLCNVRLV